MYKDGRSLIQYYCIDCNKKISLSSGYYGKGRCNKCANIGKFNPMYNKKSIGNYIDGRTLKIKTCNCGKKLSNYRSANCYECKEITVKTKQKMSLSHGGSGIPYENALYPKEFNNKLKNKIRKRDNYRCQGLNCSLIQEKHFIMYKRNLEIHHINYNKKNNNENNLITLCKLCNMKANFNRDYWTNYFINNCKNK